MTDTAKQITSDALDDGGRRQPQQDAAPPTGKLPALKVPDPEFLLSRLSAGNSAGLLSRQKRSERVGQPQALVNEVAPKKYDAAYVWAVVTQGEPVQYESFAAMPERLRAGLDEFTRDEFAAEKALWYLPLSLENRYEKPLKLKEPPGGRRFGADVDLEADVAKVETPASLLSQARDLAGILASRAPGFIDKTLRFVTGPAATVTFLKSLPSLYQALDSELGKVKLKQREAGKPVMGTFVQMTEALTKLLRKLRPLLPDGAKRAQALMDDAIKSFDAFVALSRRFGEVEDRPVVRKSDDEPELVENVLVPGIGSVTPSQIDPKLLADLTDEQVQDADLNIHRFFRENFAGTDRTTLNGDTREDVVNAHIHILAELAKRKINHPGGPDELDVETRALEPDAYAPFVTKRDTAMVHAGRAEDFGSEITLDEVTLHYRDIVLRSPAVYIVGGLAVRGRTAGDIDMLIREPLDPETKHAVKFRLGRALPPELSKRVSFLDDASGGPYTDHVELYDLVLRRCSDLQVKRMALEITKQDDPLMDLPPIKDQKRRGIWQFHFRGKSLHADLRMHTGKDFLTGWTVLLQKTGQVPEVNTVAEGRRIARDFTAQGSRYTKPFLAPANVRATSKSRQPMAWLEIEDQVIEPGQVGATRLEEGVIVTTDQPQVEWGLQKPFAHEYFLTGKGAKVAGILFFRLLTGEPGAPKEEVEAGRRTAAGEAFWVMKLTKSLLPSVLKPRAVQTESIPSFGYPAIPKTLAEVVPKQYQYWTIKNDRERRDVRDALVASKFFTEDNVRIVDGEFRRTVTKRYLYVPDETELAKQPAVVPFVVSWQWWKGQEVVRGGPSRQVWHLMLDTAAPGLESWVLQSDPVASDRSSAIQTPRKQKDLLDYEGDVEPGQRIGGDVLNETKATPSGILIKDRGRATLLEDGESFKKIRFTGKSLRGTYVLVQEEAGSPIWTFARGTEPGRRIPAEKLDGDAAPQTCDLDSVLFNDALQMYAEKAIPVRDGVQHWDPKRKDPDADRGQLKPLAIFQPQKGPSRETNMFRGDEVDRVLEDFATPNVLRDGVFIEPKYNGFRVVAEKAGERVIMFTEDEKRDISPALPSVTQELKAMPGDFVLDSELVAFEPDGVAVPRRELALFRGTKPSDDSGVRIRVVEALFLPKHGNITAEIYEEVRKRIADYLKGQKLKHVELTPAKLVKTESELRDAIKWASKQPASEGAMLKIAPATYSLGGENDGWAKIKIAREIKALIYDKHPVKDSPGVYNYFGAVGPISRQERDRWEETVKVAGKWYVPIGKTANTKQPAKIGDTVRVEATEILIDRRKDKASMRWFGPVVVVEVSDQKPMTPKDIEGLALPGEVEKRGLPTFDVEVLKFDDGERYVEGVVLQPTDERAGLKPDAQKDIYSKEEIRKALHFYMENGPRFKDQHGNWIDKKVKLLETWQTRAPYTVGNRTVAEGAWIMCLRILDTPLWNAVRSGQRTGFSIGGVARREAA